MIKRAETGFLSGFVVGNRDISISHLQYANDTMIFCEVDIRQIGYLRCFQAVSSLKINLAKSEIFQVGEVGNINLSVVILGCKVGSLPSSYLGLLLGARFKSKSVWNPVLGHISKKFNSWKMILLSKEGKLTMIKSTFESITNYHLSLFKIPMLMANRLRAASRTFYGTIRRSKGGFLSWIGSLFVVQ